MTDDSQPFDALLVLSFGGPEGPADVMPFLENVTRGRGVPRERLLEVAKHYHHFGGRSPINDQNRALIAALETELRSHGIELPIYWGNRNWHPLLPDTLRAMRDAGVRRALGFFTSAYSSYSGCRQYRENVVAAQEIVGPDAPRVEKLRMFFNHPGFIEPMIESTRAALERVEPARRAGARIAFTAHSIPRSMADGCRYEAQLREASRLVAEGVGVEAWELVYQSRSGPPTQPWLEPDILDHLELLAQAGTSAVVAVPIGFISDHLEVLYDLDCEAADRAAALGLSFQRAATVGTHPSFIALIRELIEERLGRAERRALGALGPSHDVCPLDCCPAPQRPRPAPG